MSQRSIHSLAALLGVLGLWGCTEQETTAELRSLAASEDAVFLCRDANGAGHPFSECPDYDGSDDADPSKQLSVYSLVSQTVTNEIAVVNVSAGHVVDVDRATPGFGFLRVGGRPISMAASPGGMATFVTTSEVGHHGVFALSTSCIEAPKDDEARRDLTSWPACRLPSAPGEIAVLVDPENVGQPCKPNPEPRSAEDAGHCTADLSLESDAGGKGRRKLVVSLPDEGRLVVLDAQDLLNERPGEFRACHIEAEVQLSVEVPSGITQSLPLDLQPTEACVEPATPTGPKPSKRPPQPAGFAVSDSRLYVADQSAPVIHVLDTASVCGLAELPSLLPMSMREPDRVVTTRKVAVSPLTPLGKRYLYAIDAEDQPGASVMAFDVSPDAVNPTPIVRPGSPEQPSEKPDRLSIGSSARDITFAYRDIPYVDDSTGVAQFGTLCDPNPLLEASAATAARPNLEFTVGARPGLLRGLFGFVLLTNGSIAVVDVEDFDAACRRPKEANTSSEVDFRGCAPDGVTAPDIEYFTKDQKSSGERLVTDEISCRVVEPHRFRRATLAVNDAEAGVRAPSLRGLPQLTLPDGAADVPTVDRPRLLGVPFWNAGELHAAEVFVGATRYTTSPGGDDALAVNPNSRASEQLEALNSVILPPLEPRAYAAEDSVSVTYEGSFIGERSAGFLAEGLTLTDSSLSFCNGGVYDVPTMTGYAREQLGLDEAAAAAFGETHADYVQLTGEIPKASDAYWTDDSESSYDECLALFGPADADELQKTRDFTITSAVSTQLKLAPRPGEKAKEVALRAADCFPAANNYRVRGGKQWIVTHAAYGFRHDVIEVGAERRCERTCNPLRKWAKGRVFEISSRSCRAADSTADPLEQRVGCAEPDEVACVFDQDAKVEGDADAREAPVLANSASRACVFDGLTERFALYRGRAESQRDAVFSWQTTGGYTPLIMSLAAISSTVSPQSIQFLQHPEVLAVVDGSSQGLSLFSLDTFVVAKPSPFY